MKYINKHKIKINESILKDTLPSDIVSAIITHKTYLGNNPAIPDIFDVPFLAKIADKRVKDITKELKEIGSINDIKSNDLYSGLAELILKCKEYEKPFRNELEKICYNFIMDLFSIPEETINFNIELKESLTSSRNNIPLDPIDNDIELDNIEDAMSLKQEIYKRKILNTLSVGGAMSLYKSMIKFYENEIMKLNPHLLDLYNKILLINEYLLFNKENIGITEENNLEMGLVEVHLGNNEFKTTINVQATLFPILVIETIKGLMELFISHGLPQDRNRTMALLKQTEYIKAEPWCIRFGNELWNLFFISLNDINSKELPYLLKRISTLEIDKFNFLMKEIFAKTKKSKQIMSILCNKAKNDMDYNRFINKMDNMKLNTSLITDEYIHLDEL